MKKLVMLLVAASMAVTVSAQINYDPNPIKRKVLEVDGLMNDTRNHNKATNWMLKGDTYYAAAMEPIKGLAKSISKGDLIKLAGEPSATNEVTLKGTTYDVMVYNNYDVYFPKGQNLASFWVQKIELVPNALDGATDAFLKAYELNNGLKDRVKSRFIDAYGEYKRIGDMAIPTGDNKTMRDAFMKAWELGKHPLVDRRDSLLAYNAGYLSMLLEDYDTSLKYLLAAKEQGLENKGEIYKLLYYANAGKKDVEASEKALMEGIEKYPDNTELIELLLTSYSSTGKDVSALTDLIEKALSQNPNSYNLNFGMGMIYDKMKDYPNAIKYFSKAAEVSPGEFGPFYNWGVAQARVGDALVAELNAIPPTQPDNYMAKREEVYSAWKAAIIPLEKALALKPGDPSTKEMLMSFYLRFKDNDPEMAAKYEKLENLQ